MKFTRIVQGAASVAAAVNPALGGVLAIVNAFLPDDKKLPVSATGTEVERAFNALPGESQQQVLARVDLEIVESNNFAANFQAMAAADAKGNTSRPYVVLLFAWVIALSVIAVVAGMVFAVVVGDKDTLKALGDAWVVIAAVLSVPATVVQRYFGLRTREKTFRYAAGSGQDLGSVFGGILGGIGGKFR